MSTRKQFFDTIRPAFRRGKLTSAQVTGLNAIINYGRKTGYSQAHLAYVLATVFHETGQRMQPIREGFCKTDGGSRRAVARLFSKGIISRNYALPDKNGNSFYGRGYVQLTHKANYAKWGWENDPDRVLEPEIAMCILFEGMHHGMFRKGKSLAMISDNPTLANFKAARGIINGDVRKNGVRIAHHAIKFHTALAPIYHYDHSGQATALYITDTSHTVV